MKWLTTADIAVLRGYEGPNARNSARRWVSRNAPGRIRRRGRRLELSEADYRRIIEGRRTEDKLTKLLAVVGDHDEQISDLTRRVDLLALRVVNRDKT